MLNAAITGIGMSTLGRTTGRAAILHLAEAAREALADAGLMRADIDGLTTYPGKANNSPGMAPIGCTEVREALGLKTRWHSSSAEGPAQMSPLMIAAMAVSTGQARHVLCFRALTESSSQTAGRRASVPSGTGQRLDGWFQYLLPMGAYSASNWAAMFARKHFEDFGLTRGHLGAQCVQQRANAQANPRAIFHGTQLSLDDYLGARMISDPLGLFDCDIPIDGACVIIISAVDAARDCRKPPIAIAGMSAALTGRDSWDQRADLTTMAAHDAAADMWARSDFTPADVDVAGLYDGFSIFVPMWLEAFQFCAAGEAGPLIAAGETALDGRIPTNTGGGQLSAGRLHGFGHLHEVCTQLWGEGGERQVTGAQTGVVGMGGGPLGGAMLLHRA
jgi:acetyl-CoA acetyltransferase